MMKSYNKWFDSCSNKLQESNLKNTFKIKCNTELLHGVQFNKTQKEGGGTMTFAPECSQ